MSENAIAKMTMRQAEEEMACFRKIYSIVRLLDLKTMEENPCYAPWREAHPCTRCIGREALLCKGQKSKLERVGSQIYQATARYVEVDGSPYVMEMIQPLEPDSDALSHEDKRLYTDALTGVYNRRFYEDELRHKFLTAGVAMIDLDDFKLCNDTFGHEAGDAALCAVASIIQHNIRSSDMLIRYGGDELLLILPMIPADDFARKLRLINQKLSGARVPGFERLRITSSIGGVLSAGVSIEEAVKLADKRMYQAKRQKNRVVTENEPQNVLNVQSQPRPTVLIVDDSPMNREILTEILGKDFQLLEASDGAQCMSLLKQFGSGISLVLLDIVMPDMDGFEVLARMAGQDLLNDIPVIMVSSEDSSTVIHRAYELGASDFIRRPFDARIVHRRVSNLTRLYARQRRLSRMVAQQFYEREKNNRLMIAILSQVTERHNGVLENHLVCNTLEATFTADGESISTQTIDRGEKFTKPAEPPKENHTFAGWYNGDEKFDFDADTTNAPNVLNLVAKWDINKYTVQFVSEHGSFANQTIEHGKPIDTDKLTIPEVEGYTFDGWYTTDDTDSTEFDFTQPIKSNTTVYAKWTAKDYEVSFITEHGDAPASQNVPYNETATNPGELTEDGYTFIGWYTDHTCTTEFKFSTPITGDTKVYAKWEKNAPVLPDTYALNVSGAFVYVDGVDVTAPAGDTTLPLEKDVSVRLVADPDRMPSGMVFDRWTILNGALNADDAEKFETGRTLEEFAFTMPAEPLSIEATPRMQEEEGSDTVSVIAGVALGTAATALVAWQAYDLGMSLYQEHWLPADFVMPKTRAELALLLWNTAGRPAPAAQPAFADITDPDTAQAAQWAVETGLMTPKSADLFKPEKSVTRWKAVRSWKRVTNQNP